MPKKGWIDEAIRQDELKITNDEVCPFCEPEKRFINACRAHKWVSMKWYERWTIARNVARLFKKR